MRANKKVLFINLLAILIFVSTQNFIYGISILKPQTKVQASEFSLYDLEGKEVSLSDFKGRPVILFFWTTWCVHCRVQFGRLSEEYIQLKAKNIELLAIDIGEAKHKVENFLEGKNIEFPVLLDRYSKVANTYNIVGVPTFILIDAQGIIQFQGHDLPADYLELLNS